jgi:GNAT superfamily N-acetyltransferase
MSEKTSTATPKIEIRPATAADGPTILGLIEALAEFEKLAPPDAAAQQRLLQDAFGTHPRFEIFLAEVTQPGETKVVVAGYAFIFETYSTFLAQPTLYLEDLFVLTEYRGQRVGLALFNYCVEQAHLRGCGRMEWTVLHWNENAIRFYQARGAKHMDEWYLYRLTQPDFKKILED